MGLNHSTYKKNFDSLVQSLVNLIDTMELLSFSLIFLKAPTLMLNASELLEVLVKVRCDGRAGSHAGHP